MWISNSCSGFWFIHHPYSGPCQHWLMVSGITVWNLQFFLLATAFVLLFGCVVIAGWFCWRKLLLCDWNTSGPFRTSKIGITQWLYCWEIVMFLLMQNKGQVIDSAMVDGCAYLGSFLLNSRKIGLWNGMLFSPAEIQADKARLFYSPGLIQCSPVLSPTAKMVALSRIELLVGDGWSPSIKQARPMRSNLSSTITWSSSCIISLLLLAYTRLTAWHAQHLFAGARGENLLDGGAHFYDT